MELQTRAIPHIIKPDIDNMVKSILDGLDSNGIPDDKTVYDLRAIKTYSENPRTEVTIRWWEDE